MRRFLLGVGALLTIAIILVGVPVALVVVAGNPLPSAGQIHNTLALVPDYGNVILLTKVLPCLGWISWFLFAAPLLVEIGAGVTGRKTTKRIWLLRGQQFAAAALVAAVLVMVAETGAPHRVPTQPDAAPASPPISLNLNVAPPAVTPVIVPRIEPAAMPASAVSSTTTVTHVVVPGDNLWDISETYYGIGTRDMDIFRASTAIIQPDGQRLTNPNLIRPGWRLTVPDVPAPAAPAATVAPSPPQATGPDQGIHPLEFGSQIVPDPAGIPSSDTATGQPTQSAPAAPAPAHLADKTHDPDAGFVVPLSTAGGVVGLLAAGLLVVLGARRLSQRRRRRAGERIAMPGPEASGFERELRMVADPLGLADIDHALRLVQMHATDTRTALPELLAVRLAEQEVSLYFLQPTDLPNPFAPSSSDHTVWSLRPGAIPTPAKAVVSPYPALAIIGVDDNDGVLLVDLEQLGVLNISGDEELVDGVLTALAGELAGNPWGEQIQVTLVGLPPEFPRALDRFRIQHADSVNALLPGLRRDLAERAAAFRTYGLDNVHAARAQADENESWAPHILLLHEEPDEGMRDELAEFATTYGPLGVAVIVQGEVHDALASIQIESAARATLHLPGGIPPLPFAPQLMRNRELQLLQDLLNTTDQPARPTSGENEMAPTASEPDSVPTVVIQENEVAVPDGPAYPATDIETLLPIQIQTDNQTATQPSAPYLRLLGPVEIDNLNSAEPLPGRGIELMAYLLLRHGPVDGIQLQRAFWPDTPDAANNQRGLAKRVRVALGHSPSGELWLPENANHRGYVLHPQIRSDWDDFQTLVGTNPATASDENLVAALRLVRGTPFAGSNTRRWWQWIAIPQEEMIAAVMDAADELGNRALGARNASLARYAARIQQAVDPLNEAGWRIELRAALHAGDIEGFRDILTDLYARVGGEDPDYDVDDETQTLIDQANERIRA